jgi:hypothetical protein
MIKQTNLRQILKNSALCSVAMLIPLCAQAAEPAAPASAPAKWSDTLTLTGQIDTGITVNPADPQDHKNFGRLMDDKANTPLFNQFLLTAQRPMDATKPYDVGFKLQMMVGSDARYTHFIKEFQNSFTGINQLDLVEGWVQVHTPWFTSGGFDIKVGQYVTLEGAETIDPSTNVFYSHSYIFNFGLPFKHTGVMTVLHATPMVDIYLGVDSGVNTSLFTGDNNGRPAFHGGIGLNFAKGTILATTHIGPEISRDAVPNDLLPSTVNANHAMRYLNDITAVFHLTDKLTSTTDFNYIHDNAVNGGNSATGYGLAQIFSYAVNETFTVSGRAEIYRDQNGFWVAQSGNNVDWMRAQTGLPALSARSVGGGITTYGALTLGVNFKPALGIAQIKGFVIRPEVRYDTSLNSTRPFNDSSDKGMFTAAIDMVLGF